MTATPDYRLVVDGRDITPTVRPLLIALRLSEKRCGDADQLEITLDDSRGAVALPPAGAEIRVSLGWKAGALVDIGLVDKGRFVVDEVEHSGPPDAVTIRARSADMTSAIRTRREGSWHRTTLGAIVRQVAARNRLRPSIAATLAGIAVRALTQGRESDLAFLRRLGREHDATATIKDGALIFAPIGAGTTASGAAIPGLTIRRRDGDRHAFRIEKREETGSVEARWHDRAGARRQTVKIGDGTPVRRLSRIYPSEAAARTAAQAERGRSGRAPRKLDLTLALGRLDIYPDRPVTAEGFKAEIDAVRWLVAEVSHTLTADNGFSTSVSLESAGR